MKRCLPFAPAILIATSLLISSSRGQTTFRDDFDAFHDYHTGTVPAGGIWTGVNNATNGDNAGLEAKFVSNGEDGFGNPKPGVLFIEDLNGGPAGTGVGFEGSRNTAPMVYREIDPSLDWDAKIKINAQTAGNWSAAGIVARRAGPPIGISPLDATEQFAAAYAFRADGGNPDNATVLTKNIVNGAQVTDANVAFTVAGAPAPTAPMPVYIRFTKQGGTIISQSSLDGTTWFTKTTLTNTAALLAPGAMLQVGPSFMMFGAGQGTTDIDFFEIIIGAQSVTASSWNIAGGGNWNTTANWASTPVPGVPSSNQVEVTFGAAATAPATVFTDANVTARRLVFNNANKYAIAGTGTVTLEASTGNAEIAVQSGSHEIQTATTLTTSNLAVSAAASTRLDFNNKLNLNGRTMTVTGPGVVSINNNLPSGGAAGTVANSGATLQGSGTITGALQNLASGVVSPGNNGLGTLSVTGNFTQQASSSVLLEIGGASPELYDKLAVGGAMTGAGTINVQLVNGFAPSAGNSFDVLDFTTKAAGITLGALPALSAGLSWDTSAFNTTGVLSIAGGPTIDTDFNNDGRTDGADFLIWQRNVGVAGRTNATGDSNGDGLADAADLGNWKTRFGTAEAVAGAVPEPASMSLVAMALGVAALRRRRTK